jgi:uncharacterized membrane protein HdeD (DUF308 family)
MAFTDRSQIVRKHGQGSTDRTKELFAGILLGALIATLGMRNVMPTDALAPAVATLLFTLGAATAGFAVLCRRNQARTMWLDIAGVLTFVGVAVSILIEPDQMVRLFTLSDQPDQPDPFSAV